MLGYIHLLIQLYIISPFSVAWGYFKGENWDGFEEDEEKWRENQLNANGSIQIQMVNSTIGGESVETWGKDVHVKNDATTAITGTGGHAASNPNYHHQYGQNYTPNAAFHTPNANANANANVNVAHSFGTAAQPMLAPLPCEFSQTDQNSNSKYSRPGVTPNAPPVVANLDATFAPAPAPRGTANIVNIDSYNPSAPPLTRPNSVPFAIPSAYPSPPPHGVWDNSPSNVDEVPPPTPNTVGVRYVDP